MVCVRDISASPVITNIHKFSSLAAIYNVHDALLS